MPSGCNQARKGFLPLPQRSKAKRGRTTGVARPKSRTPTLVDFILERYDELIEKVVRAEVRRKQIEEELEFMRKAFLAAMQRPITIGMTDTQVDKIAVGLGKILMEQFQQGEVH